MDGSRSSLGVECWNSIVQRWVCIGTSLGSNWLVSSVFLLSLRTVSGQSEHEDACLAGEHGRHETQARMTQKVRAGLDRDCSRFDKIRVCNINGIPSTHLL